MHRRLLNADTGAVFGLVAGIILGSLALNLSGAGDPPRSGDDAPGHSAAGAAVISGVVSGSTVASHR
jgi:hypothetical protein